jgi:hypothetical protein
METATVVLPGRARPKAVEEEIARQQAAKEAAVAPVTVRPVLETPPTAATRPLPKPKTLPPLTGSIPPPAAEEPRKGSGAIWLSLLLLLIVGVGGYFIWPKIKSELPAQLQSTTGAPAQPAAAPDAATDAGKSADAGKAGGAAADAGAATPAKATEPEPAATDPASAKVQSEVEQRLAEGGFGQKLRARVQGRNLVLTGTLTEEEHRRLRARIAKIAPRLRVNDQIQVARAGAAPPSGEEEARPRTSPGRGEVEALTTDLLGATVKLTGPKGEVQSARTPTRFEDLPPGRYALEFSKDGYRTERRIVNVNPGRVVKEEVRLQAVLGGLMVNSSPGNATIYINGQQREERTPATIRLPPGTYRVEVEMEGYEGTSRSVQVQGEDLLNVTFTLPRLTSGRARPGGSTSAPAANAPPVANAPPAQQPAARPAGDGFVEVRSVPPGADIILNGTNTGRKTPARLELPAGSYRLTIFLRGYAAVQRAIQVEPGQTVTLNESLARP